MLKILSFNKGDNMQYFLIERETLMSMIAEINTLLRPKYRMKHDRKRLDVLRMFIFKNADNDGNFKVELKPYKTISRKIEHVEF